MNRTILALALLPFGAASVAHAASYTYAPDGTTVNWSDTGNWNNGSGTGQGYPNSSADTANIPLASGNQTVIYDTTPSGTVGTINMTNAGTGLNEIDVQKISLTVSTALTLGSTTGTNEIFMDAMAAQAVNTFSTTLVASNGVTLNTGGILEAHPFGATSNAAGFQLTGSLSLAGGSFIIDQAQGPSTGTATSVSNTISGALNMSSGTITFSKVVTPGTTSGTTNLVVADNRLTVGGNLNITGGTINVATGTGTVIANQANSGSVFMNGATNVMTGVSLNGGSLGALSFTFGRGGTTPVESFTTDQVVGVLNERFATTGGALTVTNSNTSATGNIAQLGFIGLTGGGASTATVNLGSNLTATTGSGQAISAQSVTYTTGSTPNFVLDLEGFTFDASKTTTLTPTNPSTAATVSFTFQSTGGTGTLKAAGFNFASTASVGAAATTIGANVILNSTGGNGQANNLGTTASTMGTINASSTFLYSGSATTTGAGSTTEATLVSTNRNIGILQVTTGALNINQSALTTGGAVAVSGAGTLDLNGTGYGALTLAAGNFSANTNAILELTLGANLDTINATVAGQSFSLNGVTIAINGSASQPTYQVFTGFTGTNTVTGVTFTGVPAGETASIDTTGLITFSATAVPEPGTWVGGVLLVGALGVWGRRRHRQVARLV